jgi:hypothetical protein
MTSFAGRRTALQTFPLGFGTILAGGAERRRIFDGRGVTSIDMTELRRAEEARLDAQNGLSALSGHRYPGRQEISNSFVCQNRQLRS